MRDTEPGEALSTELNRLSEIAARDSKVKFTKGYRWIYAANL